MDELLKDFLVETGEHIEAVTAQLVRFERDPGDTRIIANIFRLVHSIKGTCGFLDLPRLEAVAHAAETLIGRLRDGAPPTPDAVTLVLRAVDRIRQIVAGIEQTEIEPPGDDSQLIAELVSRASGVRLRQPDNEAWDGPDGEAEAGATAHALLPERRIETVRVSVGTLERLMSLVSELVLARNQLFDRARTIAGETLEAPLQRLASVTTDLQHGVMKARMQPIGRLFASLPRIVRDMSAELGKKIEVSTSGGDTELDRQLIAVVRDPLTHMIRNAVGHGIETPEARRAAGKRETGLISVSAYHDAGSIVIEVSDDGRGVDVEAIRVKAVAKGLGKEAEVACLSDAEVSRFIFAPGFSTAHAVTPLQGRGVGMDVVRENIEAIGGSVALTSTPGAGATFVVKLPITLAIAPALVVGVGGERFALPQDGVVEVYEIGEGETRIETMQGALVAICQRGVLSAADLRDLLKIGEAPHARRPATHVVVMRIGARLFGVLVEEIVEVLDIVVKPLPTRLARIGMYAGNTILGDGSVMLILDAAGLAAALGIERQDTFRIASRSAEADAEPATPVVLFRRSGGPLQALPASAVRRIDQVCEADLAVVDGAVTTRVAGRLTPVIGAQAARWEASIPGRPAAFRPLLSIGRETETVGLLVDEIVDVIEARLDIEIGGRGDGVVGAATIGGEAVEIPDVGWLMERARPGFAQRGADGRARVALCEPEDFFRDLLRPVLAGAGYDVAAFADVEAAFAALDPAPAALLVDCEGQAAAGLELTRRLRASQDHG
ncbi:MAG: chemotaxis protein CheA, partial [Methylobacteriaceae bacterium]|nr:chemotaxis protein CheA [Methylobacteriaceae bacterium]